MTKTRHIRIGNQTAFSAPTILEPFRYAVTKGFDAFEWFPDKKESGEGWTEEDFKKTPRKLIKKIAIDHNISLSVHAPWQANPLENDADKILLQNIQFTQDVGASIFNIHFYEEEGVNAYVQAIQPLINRLAMHNIKLSIENTTTTGPEVFNELFERLRNDYPKEAESVGMCLDLGHANLCRETRNDYLKYIDLLDRKLPIIHIHMHENFGDYDSHLPLFTGPSKNDFSGIDGFLSRLKARNFSGSIILEQWPQPPGLLNTARNRLLKMINTRFLM